MDGMGMTTVRITYQDGSILRDAPDAVINAAMAVGQQPQDAAERLARFASGQAVKVRGAMWAMA